MQSKNNFVAIILIIIGIVLGWFIADVLKSTPKGKVLINQSTVDTLYAYKAFADSVSKLSFEPDTVHIVETVIKEVPKYITTTPEREETPNDSVLQYNDSLIVEEEIAVWVEIMLNRYDQDDFSINWKYTPIVKHTKTTIEIPVPQPIVTTIETPVFVTGHYLSVAAGGSDKFFTFGIDYDMVKESRIYGLQYRRQGDMNVYGIKIGINLSSIFKK